LANEQHVKNDELALMLIYSKGSSHGQ